MVKKIKYAFFDLDGTLLNSKKEISWKTLIALSKLRDNGIKIGIASGRPYFMCKDVFELIKPDLPMIAINGATIFDFKNQRLDPVNKILESDKILLYKYLVKNKINFLIYTSNTMYFNNPIKNSSWIEWLNSTLKKRPVNQKWNFKEVLESKIKEEDVFKFLVIAEDMEQMQIEKLNNFLITMKNIATVKSQSRVIDIMHKDVNKGNALKKISDLGIIDLKEVMAFGDALNDLSMIKNAAKGIAMGNAVQGIKKVATKIIGSNDEEGIYNFIMELVNENKF